MDKKEKNRIACKKYRQSEKGKEAKARADKKYRQSEKGKEINRIAVKKYSQTEKGKKTMKENSKKWGLDNPNKIIIARWKWRGIIWDDYDIIYDLYINATNCDYCSKEFKNSLDKCCDHDHDITDANNIRGFLCRVCNIKDVLKGYDIMELC